MSSLLATSPGLQAHLMVKFHHMHSAYPNIPKICPNFFLEHESPQKIPPFFLYNDNSSFITTHSNSHLMKSKLHHFTIHTAYYGNVPVIDIR